MLIAQCRNALTPLLMHWSYCSLALKYWCMTKPLPCLAPCWLCQFINVCFKKHKNSPCKKIIPRLLFSTVVIPTLIQHPGISVKHALEHLPSNPYHKPHLGGQLNCLSLRCSWSIACWCCSNYIFITYLTASFNGLGKDNCKMRQKYLGSGIWCILY